MYQQQAPLPGAYYGPPVPPQASYYAPQRRRCSWIRCLLWTIIALGFAFALVVFIVWLVFRPTKIAVAVDTATLSNFNLTAGDSSTSTLSYNLTADITVRNPNRKLGVRYNWLEADSYYRGARFDSTALPTFFQGRKNSTVLHLAAAGSGKLVYLGSSDVEGYKSDVSGGGTFHVDLWIVGRVRYKYGSVETRQNTLRVKCPLTVTLTAPATKASTSFPRTECKVEKW